ncbi:MAG: lysophospholipid acyltransferase family protein, partial [Planctomycetota bacterium]
MSDEGTPREWQGPPPGGPLRGIVMFLPAVVWAFGYVMLLIPTLLLFPGWSRRNRTPIIRTWGKVLLWMFGVKLDLHGLDNRDLDEARILATNHVSLLDLMVYSAAWAGNGTVIYKREFERIPLIG